MLKRKKLPPCTASRIPFIILFLILSCTSTQKPQTFEVKTVKTFNLSAETLEYVLSMYTTVIDNPNRNELAFTNYSSPVHVVITDYEGNFVAKVGKEGRGPKEILTARFFGFDDSSNVVVLDKASAFFKNFNRSSGEVHSYTYPIKDGISVTSRNLKKCGNAWYFAVQLLGEPTLPEVATISVFDSSFKMIYSFGGYDPFFDGREGILQETLIDIDCDNGKIFTSHAKVPFIQSFSIETQDLLSRSKEIPSSFLLSDKFIKMVSSKIEMTRYLSEEQSVSLHLAHSDDYLLHIFRNENNIVSNVRKLNDSDHLVAVYDKETMAFLGEASLPGAILGSTKDGHLIMLSDESSYEIQFVEIVSKTDF